MKFPWMQFYVSDWRADPAVSACSPATRGIWIDLLCAMHELDRSGVITGSPESLSRTCRCSAVELAQALEEIRSRRVADVTERYGVVTVINRRMLREAKERAGSKLRMQKKRCSELVTQNYKRTSHIPEYRVQSTERDTRAREAAIPTWPEVKTEADLRGVPEASARAFFDHHEGNALWVNQHQQIIHWRHKLVAWAAHDRQPGGKNANRKSGVNRNEGTYNAGASTADLQRKVR